MADLTAMLQAAAGAGGEYQISRSLRFNSADSAYLSRTPASASNRKTWTWSGWVKRSKFGDDEVMFSGGVSDPTTVIRFSGEGAASPDGLRVFHYAAGFQFDLTSTAQFRDPSAWYHILVACDTTQATSSNRIKIYVNGVQVTAFDTATYPSLNYDTSINNTVAQNVGRGGAGSNYLNGYLTEINCIDGQALTPTSFGKTNATTGAWSPIAYAGSYGTNGFYLNFSDNTSTTTLGEDQAGSNDWTLNNFSVTAGAGNDSLVDVPTRNTEDVDTGAGGEVRGNYATLNPLNNGSQAVLSNGNLDVSWSSTSGHSAGSTIAVSSGKWYVEFTMGSSVVLIGIIPATYALKLDNWPGNSAYGAISYSYLSSNGNKYNNSSNTAYGATFTTGDVIGVALDLDAGTLVFYKNGVSQGTAYSSITGSYIFAIGYGSSPTGGTVANANFGQRPFAHTAPSGFKALVTTNLPDPTVVQGDDYFNTVLYTGNGSTQSITGVGFQPDFVWNKYRDSGSNWHNVSDSVRGAGYRIFPNDTGAEQFSATDYLTSFNADGFSVGSSNDFNESAGSYVAWNWRANGAGVSNTDGTISSTVSVSTTSGFSIVTYTGSGSAATVGHGLGVAPQMFIIKGRSIATGWIVYHAFDDASPATGYMALQTTDAFFTSPAFNDTAPTSTVFSINGTGYAVNNSGETYVAYCFAEVEGFSKIGSYTGNGSADGPFVYTGFRPAFVLIKHSNDVNSWFMWDDTRNTYNVTNATLKPNSEDAEETSYSIDMLSNGFKIRTSDVRQNESTSTYIYMAFAENPFKYSLAR
jgi:hypothetical protein